MFFRSLLTPFALWYYLSSASSAYFFDLTTCLLVRVGSLSSTRFVLWFIYGFISCRIYFMNFRTVWFCVYMLSDLLSNYFLNQYKMTFFISSFFVRRHLHGLWGVFLGGNGNRKRPYFLIHNVSLYLLIGPSIPPIFSYYLKVYFIVAMLNILN